MAYQEASIPNSRLMEKFEMFLDDNERDIAPNLFRSLNELMMEIDESAVEVEDTLDKLETETSELTDRVEELQTEVEELKDSE